MSAVLEKAKTANPDATPDPDTPVKDQLLVIAAFVAQRNKAESGMSAKEKKELEKKRKKEAAAAEKKAKVEAKKAEEKKKAAEAMERARIRAQQKAEEERLNPVRGAII